MAGDGGDDPEIPGDTPMTVWEHLGELRSRIVRSLIGIVPGILIAWELRQPLFEMLVAPLSKAMVKLGYEEPSIHFSNPVDPFVAYLKIAIVVGGIFASPWIFYQVWGFIAPGLYDREKRYAIPFVLASTVFFAGGAFFGYQVVFPMGFETLIGFAMMPESSSINIEPTIMINEYLTFATRMLLAFGVVFEIPVVVTFLALAQLVNWKQLMAFGRWWILVAAVVAALLTPPDVTSQLAMLIPLIVLYYLSVGIAYLLGPKVEPDEDEGDADAS
jgi:sec-independent protein translocase protein TatC